MTDQTAVESLLFDAFIPAAYRDDPAGHLEAQNWLAYLARHLEREVASPNLAWWQLRQAMPGGALELAAWLGLALLALGSTLAVRSTPTFRFGNGFAEGFVNALVLGIGSGAAFVFIIIVVVPLFLSQLRRANQKAAVSGILKGAEGPSRGMRINAVGLVGGFIGGFGFGFLSAIFGGIHAYTLGPGVGAGLGLGYILGLITGLTATPGDPATAASPREVLARDQCAAILLMLAVGLGFGLVAGVAAGLSYGPIAGLGLGLLAALAAGFSMSAIQTAFYQFRHIELQHRLADRGASEVDVNSPTAPPEADA